MTGGLLAVVEQRRRAGKCHDGAESGDNGAGRQEGKRRSGECQVHGQGRIPMDRRPATAQFRRRRFLRLHHDLWPQREKAEKSVLPSYRYFFFFFFFFSRNFPGTFP